LEEKPIKTKTAFHAKIQVHSSTSVSTVDRLAEPTLPASAAQADHGAQV